MLMFTKQTFIIEMTNASGSVIIARAICSDQAQAIAWCYVQLSEFMPVIVDHDGKHASIDEWANHTYTGVFISPTTRNHLDAMPLQLCVRAIEELTIAETK